MQWVVLSYTLPGQERSSPRVNLWRRLRRLGTVALAGGAHILPHHDECIEAFQWIAQEIRQAAGDALVMRVERFDGLSDAELIDRFHEARRKDYADLLERSVCLKLRTG